MRAQQQLMTAESAVLNIFTGSPATKGQDSGEALTYHPPTQREARQIRIVRLTVDNRPLTDHRSKLCIMIRPFIANYVVIPP